MRGGGRHPGAQAAVYLTLAVLMLVMVGAASAQTGFILVGPGTQRATCTAITAPVTNQTWCADGSLGPTGYTWFVWNGTAWVPISGGGGGGGTPGGALGSTQFNDNTGFGGAPAPVYVAAFTAANGCAGGTGINGRSIQCAINAAPIGGLVQLAPGAYSVTDVSTLTITKALTIQGTNLGKSYTPDAAPTTNSRITGGGAQTIFTVNTGQAVVFRDFSMLIGNGGTGGIGISLTAPIVNGQSLIERMAFYNGSKGVLGVAGKTLGTTVRDSYFYLQQNAGLHFGGYLNPNAGNTNCDGGGYTIDNNYFFGNNGDTGMLFDNSAAVSMTSNQGTGFNHMLHLRIGFPTACVGPGPTQWQIRGNQFDLNGRTGPTVFIEAQYGTGAYEIVGNFFGGTASVGSNVVQVDITPVIGFMFGFIFSNNNVGGGTGKALEITGPIVDANISDNSMAFGSFNVTGNTTIGSPIVTNLNLNTSFLATGMTVGAPNLPVPTTILSIDSPTQITLTNNATSTVVAEGLSISGQPVLRIDTPIYGVIVSNNTVPNPIDGHKLWDCDGCTIISPYNRGFSQNLSTLPAALDGSEMWCSDCARTQPCISVGAFAGANARRQDGAWICLDQTPTWTSAGIKESNTALQNREYLLAMIAALPSGGGRIQLPVGSLDIDNTTPIVINKTVTIEGASMGTPSGTVLKPSSGTQDLFVVTGTSPVQFRHLTIRRDTSATAGAFIHLNATSGLNGLTVIDDVTFVGCFVCVDVEAANQWRVTNAFILPAQAANAVGVLLRSTDATFGGGVVDHTSFGNGSALGVPIKVTSGASFNFHHNFFFQMASHIVIDWASATNTVNGLITNNIFNGGNVSASGVSLQTQGGGGTLSDVVIADNVFSAFTTASITSTAGALYSHITISGNSIPVGNGAIGIDTRLAGVNITANLFSGSGTAVGINIQAAATDTNYCSNQFLGTFGGGQVVNAGTGTTACQGIVGGSGAATQIAVWSGASLLTGYSDFKWEDATGNLYAMNGLITGGTVTFSAALGGNGGTFDGALNSVDYAAMLAGSSPTIKGSAANGPIYSVTIGGSNNLINGASYSVIVGGCSNTLDDGTYNVIGGGCNNTIGGGAGFSDYNFIAAGSTNVIGLGGGTVYSFIGGATGATIGDNVSQGVILGGSSGSIANGLSNAVSLNGGVVTTSDTTVVGGVEFDLVNAAFPLSGFAVVIDETAPFRGLTYTIGTEAALIIAPASGIASFSLGLSGLDFGATLGAHLIGSNGADVGELILGSASGTDGISSTGSFSINTSGPVSIGNATTKFTCCGHGASTNVQSVEEETTILVAAFTDTAFQFPAGSTSLGCTVRTTVVIPALTTVYDVGVAGATTRYATGVSGAATSTGGSAVFAAYPTATSVRITPDALPAAATGKVRVTCTYIDVTPPSS